MMTSATSVRLACLGMLAAVAGSRADISPLSIHPEGLGVGISGYSARERGMGEAGMASITKQGLCADNPSRSAFHDKTSFTASFDSDMDWLQDGESSNRASTFLIPFIGMNFQSRKLGSLGLSYQQRFHRNFDFTPSLPQNPNTVQSFSAEGGLYEMTASWAYAPISRVALGLGFHFLLGQERFIQSTQFLGTPDNPQLGNGEDLIGDTLSVRSNAWFPSLSLTVRGKRFSAAAMGTLGTALEQKTRRSISSLGSDRNLKGEKDIPWTGLVGLAYKPKSNQTIVADFSLEAWEGPPLVNPAYRAGLGYEFQGMGGPFDSYARKIAYRGGVGVERLYLEEVDEYWLTLGSGMPLGRRGNLLDLALKYGHRGSVKNNLWTEDFIRLSVSLTGVGIWGQPVRKRR